jgi:FkbM family methyltransferase
MSQPSHPFPTILARTLLLCFFVILGCLPTGGGQEGGQGQTATSSQFPVIVDDIRYLNNLTEQRVGAPIKLWIRDPNQYSRIFFSQREGELSTEVLEGIVPGKDVVLDIGPNVGVFALTAARLGARVVAVEADGVYAASVSKGAKINGLEDKVLVAEWLPSSHEGFATVFAKGERGCTYTGPATCNMTGQQEYVRAVNLVSFPSILPTLAPHLLALAGDSVSSTFSLNAEHPAGKRCHAQNHNYCHHQQQQQQQQ